MTHIRATTKAIILNEKHELLLLRIGEHTQRPERSHTWDLPGGFINQGESEIDGSLREIVEETGIKLDRSDLQLVFGQTGYFKEHDVSVTHLNYLVRLRHTPEVQVSWEHESYAWVDFDSVLQKYELRPHFASGIEHVQKYLMSS